MNESRRWTPKTANIIKQEIKSLVLPDENTPHLSNTLCQRQPNLNLFKPLGSMTN